MEEIKSKRKYVKSRERHVTARPQTLTGTARAKQQPGLIPKGPKPTRLPSRPKNNERNLKNMDLHRVQHDHSPCFRIRTLIQRLRPHFIEVLRTSDFRKSIAADEIKKQMKLLMDLHKQMTNDTGTQGPSSDTDPAKGNQDGNRLSQQLQPLGSDKKAVESQVVGSYIVGGSAFGWNFITFSAGSSKPIYYGVTKEARRSNNRRSADSNSPITNGFSGKGHHLSHSELNSQ